MADFLNAKTPGMKPHLKTYDGVLSMIKWSTGLIIVVLLGMAAFLV